MAPTTSRRAVAAVVATVVCMGLLLTYNKMLDRLPSQSDRLYWTFLFIGRVSIGVVWCPTYEAITGEPQITPLATFVITMCMPWVADGIWKYLM